MVKKYAVGFTEFKGGGERKTAGLGINQPFEFHNFRE
jgi:hypothetical protein